MEKDYHEELSDFKNDMRPNEDYDHIRNMQELADRVNSGEIRLFDDSDMMLSGERIKNAQATLADSVRSLRIALEAEHDKSVSVPALDNLNKAIGFLKQVNQIASKIIERDGK